MEYEDLKVEVPLEDAENSSTLLDVPVKKYQNANGEFMVGFDVTTQEAQERRLRRAKRFGIEPEAKLKQEIEALPSCVAGLPKTKQDAETRHDSILLFGVNEMSTKDVFNYFKDHMPGSIEWIDDISCVVVWEDENSSKRALVNMSVEYTPAADDKSNEQDLQEEVRNLWRIGVKHPKAKQLLMRYATKADKKTKGAGSRSLYYLTHGHPDQQNREGKKRGLISTSRKRKIMAERNRIDEELHASPEVEIFDIDVDETMETETDVMDVDEPPVKVLISEDHPRTEIPTGNLYSDQVKDKNSKSIRSRLSKTQEDKLNYSDNEDISDDDDPSKYTKINERDDLVTKNAGMSDLRQKLKSRKMGFDPNTRPNLSIEVTED